MFQAGICYLHSNKLKTIVTVPLMTLMLSPGMVNSNYHEEYVKDKPDDRTATCRGSHSKVRC